MLVLSRKPGEALRIGAECRIEIVSVSGSVVRLAIAAPDEVSIHREEVFERIARANREAARSEPEEVDAFMEVRGRTRDARCQAG